MDGIDSKEASISFYLFVREQGNMCLKENKLKLRQNLNV